MAQTATAKKNVLHVGCGPPSAAPLDPAFEPDQWQEIRLDIDPDVQPDIVASITDMSAVETESIDGLFSSHNIEHLYNHEVPVALKEFHRVLKPGGFALIRCPDIQAVAEQVVQGNLETPLFTAPAGPISALDIMYGYGRFLAQGKDSWAHKTAFTVKSLGDKLVAAGFANVQVRRAGYELLTHAIK